MERKYIVLVTLGLLLTSCASLGGPTGQLTFETDRDGNNEVYIIGVDGTDPINLTDHPDYDGTPNWSPDGSQLVFTSERSGNPEVWIMDGDGGNLRQVTNGKGFNVVPDWSPDGENVLFSSNRTYLRSVEGGEVSIPDNTKLWVTRIGEELAERLTGGLGLDLYADWSPDGETIVFMSVRDGNPEIYIKPMDQSEWNLTESPSQDLNPAWSPDGNQVAFMSDRGGDFDIYVIAPERDAEPVNISNHPAGDGDPAWSPDGKWIAFISDRDGNTEVYVMRSDGSDVRRVTNNPADDLHPQWRPE